MTSINSIVDKQTLNPKKQAILAWNGTYMHWNKGQYTPVHVLPQRSYHEHHSFIYQKAHEEIQHEVHEQAEFISQSYEKIEDQARWYGDEE